MKHATGESLGRVDRTQTVRFTFDGRELTGYAGDTLASALLRNGIHLVGRSFKYHRPRGILAAGAEEPNALVAVRRDDARYITQPPRHPGGVVRGPGSSQPEPLAQPRIRCRGRQQPDLPVSFPPGFTTRLSCGRGAPGNRCTSRASAKPQAWVNHLGLRIPIVIRTASLTATCWSSARGPAGHSAALAACRHWRGTVILCDEQPEFGGSLLVGSAAGHAAAQIEGVRASEWVARAVEALRRNPRVTLLTRTTAFGYFPHNMVGLNPAAHRSLWPLPHPDSTT